MIYEFVGFPAYEAAVESEIGLPVFCLLMPPMNSVFVSAGFISWFARELWI